MPKGMYPQSATAESFFKDILIFGVVILLIGGVIIGNAYISHQIAGSSFQSQNLRLSILLGLFVIEGLFLGVLYKIKPND